MTAITVRAATSQKAMEEILRRLGPDALILSTRKTDGQYELRASADGADADAADADPPPQTACAASWQRNSEPSASLRAA